MDNFKTIYRILRYLEKAMDYDSADLDFISSTHLGITENRWTVIMGLLAREGYIDGIRIKRSVDGEVIVSVYSPRITLKGLEYLKENSLMQKAANLAKGVADFMP